MYNCTLAVEKAKHTISCLLENKRPGPDLYGLPCEVVILMAFLAMMFFCRAFHSIKSRSYAEKENKLGQQVAEAFEDKCKVLDILSECQQTYEKLEADLADQASERENLQEMAKKLKQSSAKIQEELNRLEKDLESQKASRSQQDELLAGMQLSVKRMEEEARDQKSQMEQARTIFKIHEMNRERLRKNLQAAKEENCHLQESKDWLLQAAERRDEWLNELAEQIRMRESSQSNMQEDCCHKDKQIKTLAECLLKMMDCDSELEEEANGKENNGKGAPENGDCLDAHQRQEVQELVDAAKMKADLKAMQKEKNKLFARLSDKVKSNEDLQDRIEKLQSDKVLLESERVESISDTQELQQTVQIMAEMYLEDELRLQRKLMEEVRERLQTEEKLMREDEKISMAVEEISSYRERSKELEEELERTRQGYKNQIAGHEKKAHDNWLAARATDQELADIRRENAHLRQKITDAQFALELVERDPSALGVPGGSLFRGERCSFGPSPPGHPSWENRAFLSLPTVLNGLLQFSRGPGGRGEACEPDSDELRMPPDADPQRPLTPLEHREHFPRRGPYGPRDFFLPRGAPPYEAHPGMFHWFPPPPPYHMGYQPVRPLPDSVQGPPTGREQSGNQLPPPQDNI